MSNKKIEYSPASSTYLKKLKEKPLKKLFLSAIEEILVDPYKAGELKTGDLSGIYGYDVRYKGANYEIAYAIRENEDGELVIIILVGSRENFYPLLKKYLKSSDILKR